MSFEAKNNQIRITDLNGDVVFETASPMPHIAAQITKTVTHAFPKSPNTAVTIARSRTPTLFSGCQEYQCQTAYLCKTEFTCGYSYQCSYQYVCGTDLFGNYACGFQNVCGDVFSCGNVETCGFETVCDWGAVEGYATKSANQVSALEHSTTYTLGSAPKGTDPDFLMVLMKAQRTSIGAQADFGPFVSAIPNHETIVGNGSTLLESAFIPGGAPWLSRIVSVFLEGDSVKAEFKHSNRQYTSVLALSQSESCLAYPDPSAPEDPTGSTWEITFTVYVGKFTAP